MSVFNRVWVLGALLLALTPALALACDDDSKSTSASASATASASASSSTSSAPDVKVKTTCKVKVSIDNKCSFDFKMINTEAAHRSGWTPGHLIEPDSMKLDPAQEPEIKDAEWVTISYANGSIQSIKKGERSKKNRTAARPTGATGPAVQSAPNPY
jgi:hypothetical protein